MAAWWSRPKSKMKADVAAKTKRSVPSGVFQKCDDCGETVPSGQVKENMWTCPKCGFHFVMPTEERIKITVDEGSFAEEDRTIQPEDPLEFRDSKRYADRLRTAQKQVGVADAFREGLATIGGLPVSVGFFVFEFMGGSMGSVVGEKLARLARRSADKRIPMVVVCTSGGARMQEGALSLMQMAKTSAAISLMKQAAVPYISILTDPTTGGVSASFAMQGDVILAEPGAVIGFAGQRVIKQTIGQDLPEGFQTAEFLLEKGQVDDVVPRASLRETTSRLLRHMRGRKVKQATTPDAAA
jgi:acetyl-CoA carboxylase carboxyl transferase subunit beta